MFDDILNDEIVTEEESKKETNSYSGFKRKKDEVQDPYIPISIYIDRSFPDNVKEDLYKVCSKLINKKFTVRVNGDDKELITKIEKLSDKFVEVYIPWKGFNEFDSKHYFNNLTCKHIAKESFAGWGKIPDPVKAMLSRNVRMIFGDKNNSIVLCLITWSPDGASKFSEVTKETGRSSFIISIATKYSFPVLNIKKPNSQLILEKTFNL